MTLEIGQRLAEMRKQAGLSQEALAEKLGISRQAVSKWERAESAPDTDNLIALSKLYGVSLDELLLPGQPEKSQQSPFEEEAPAAPEPPDPFAEENDTHSVPQESFEESEVFQPEEVSQEEESVWNQRRSLWQRIHDRFDGIFPLIIVFLYLILGACFQWWHPAWLLFLLIPIYYAGLYGGYPVLVTFLFLLAGFGFGWWHPAWLLFLTIPLFYWLYHPNSQEEA